MKTHGLNRHTLSFVLVAAAASILLLAACQPANRSTSPAPTQPAATSLPAQPSEATQVPLESTQSGKISLDLSGAAQSQTIETVEAVPASTGGPFWEIMPQYRRVTLQGYPATDHPIKPQIFIYPLTDLSNSNEAAGQISADLKTLLQTQQVADHMPFLPLSNTSQVMHTQVQFLDFKNGRGLRFLTQFDQAPMPINNVGLIYTFQGLSNDGQYYIAAVLPVTHPDLPNSQQVSEQQAAELNDFPAYLSKTVSWLEQQPGGSFTPDLSKLDALIQSIEVKQDI